MDVFSHAAWGVACFRKRVRWWAAAAVGALPDLVAFLPARVNELVHGTPNVLHEQRPMSDYPALTFDLYNFTHSLFGASLVALGAWLVLHMSDRVRKRIDAREDGATSAGVLTLWLMAPWALHLAIDAPLHTADFFPTPLLWPFSDRVIDGIPWAQPAVWLPNLALLALALWLTWPRAQKAAD